MTCGSLSVQTSIHSSVHFISVNRCSPLTATMIVMVILSMVVLQTACNSESPLVHTSCGTLRGVNMKAENGNNFTAFLGIRYAAAPLGKLRFIKPQPPKCWEGVKDATVEGSPCIQQNIWFPQIPSGIVGDEDCLFLNVFSPNISQRAKLPVLVFIHGGGFYFGSSSLGLHGPEYFLEHDIVLISFQYRLGVFGFLSTGDTVIPGNLGLKDQVRALQWVHEHVHNFGGDPQTLTIVGNSAGASCVHLHMQSPLSKGLFARGISQSGSALNPFALVDKKNAIKIAYDLANNLNCITNSSRDILECLHHHSQEDIQNAHNKLIFSKFYNNYMMRPVIEDPTVEGAFLTSDPFNTVTDTPWLVGVNSEEGAFKVAILYLTQNVDELNLGFDHFGPQSMLFDHKVPKVFSDKIRHYYFGNKTISKSTLGNFVDLYTDSWFFSPISQAVRQHSGPLYYYLFDHCGQHSFTEYFKLNFSLGTAHCDELIYLFKMPNLFRGQLNHTDINISKLMVKMWVNFATYGNPTPQSIPENPQIDSGSSMLWKMSQDAEYLHIQTSRLSLKKNMFLDRDLFWRSLQRMVHGSRIKFD